MQGFIDFLTQFMANPQNAAAVGTVLGLLVSAAHVRGYKTPVLSYLLDFLHGQNAAVPDKQAPVAPATTPGLLQQILSEIRALRHPAPPSAPSAPAA